MKLWVWAGALDCRTATHYSLLPMGGWNLAVDEAEAIGMATIFMRDFAHEKGFGWKIAGAPSVKEMDTEEVRKALALVDADAAEDAAESV